MSKPKVHVEELPEPLFDWVKDVNIPDPTTQKLLYLGTTIKVNNQLIALDPLTCVELEDLRDVVNAAVEYELKQREEEKSRKDSDST